MPIVRACQAARLSRAAYYRPGIDRVARDAAVITALQSIVAGEQRWGFWKCRDRLRAQGYGWNHKRIWRVYCQLRLNLPRRTKRRVPQRERQSLLGFKPVTINVTDPTRSPAPFTIAKYVSRGVLSAEGEDRQLFAVPAPPKALRDLRGIRVGGATYVYVSKAQWHQAFDQRMSVSLR